MERQKGFTLTEMLVVIALIALIALFAVPKISNYFRISLNSTTRNIATTVREAYNATLITGSVHRLVYDFSDNTYWVESGPSTVLLDTDSSKEKEERRQRLKFGKKEEKPKFSIEKSITKKKMSLPRGVVFEDIFTEQMPEAIKKGVAYTHFFPHGITEQTLIHIKDNDDNKTTLVISSLIGKTTVMSYYATKEDVFGKK